MTATLTTHPPPAAPAAPTAGHGLAALLRETDERRDLREEIVAAASAAGLTLAEAGARSGSGSTARRDLAARLHASPEEVLEAAATERALRRLHGVHDRELVECLEAMPREHYAARDLFGLLDGSRVPARPVAAALNSSGRPSPRLEPERGAATRATRAALDGPHRPATVDSARARGLLAAAGVPADRAPGVAESSRPGRALWCAPATAQAGSPAGRGDRPTLVVAESARARGRRLRLVGRALAAGVGLDGPQGYRDNGGALELAARRARTTQKAVRRAVRHEAALRLLEEQADPEYRRLLAAHEPAEMTTREIGLLARRTHVPARALVDLCEREVAAGNASWSTLADQLDLSGGTHLQRLVGQRAQSGHAKDGRRHEGRATRVVRVDLAGAVVAALGIPPVEFPGL